MNDIQVKLLAKIPEHLTKFLDSLTDNELNELNSIDKQLISKVYQAGAIFTIEALLEIKDEDK